MLETVREYALARLASSDDAEVTGRRHRDWYLRVAERVPSTQLDPVQEAVLDENRTTCRPHFAGAASAERQTRACDWARHWPVSGICAGPATIRRGRPIAGPRWPP
jgi:hypothetical protein